MQVELDKEDLVCLVRGSLPYYDVMDKMQNLGQYSGGFAERWNWRVSELRELTEEELYAVYITCKNSWKQVKK